MQEKVVMQRSALLVVECSNTAIVVSEVAQYMSCWHHCSKVKEAIKRVEKEGLQTDVKKENKRCLLIFLYTPPRPRDDICHKHHKQGLCKNITTLVKSYFVDVF